MKTKSEAVGVISQLLGALSDKFDTDDDAERDYLAEHCPGHLKSAAREIPTLAMHLLDRIGDEPVNIVGLAAQSGQLKGTVSKHVQRLVDAGLVERNPVPGNRKEIRLSLTADGRTVARVHRQMHDEKDEGLTEFLSRYSAAELATVTKVLTDLLATQRRGVRLIGGADQ
ncbi:MarR family winged helix-turn-helix transcriptional regulator [Mycolicibacterium komossense]|uniref:MarR family transcriptional regulator n=1 Tax=Mycolicibacterium komossense TaxID=1779 RepID=A0ABT3CKH4_9MYCO|nr:MarR family transcriptional regulator [Mycolicibacterium komossense]MCV7229741.1 MarR family transcriptional regulator [Mycolicibacterium komossense]